jgi:hypothetical protein
MTTDKMDSLLKLTEDIVTAADGITKHVMTVMDDIFEGKNEHPDPNIRKPDESNTKTDRETSSGSSAAN